MESTRPSITISKVVVLISAACLFPRVSCAFGSVCLKSDILTSSDSQDAYFGSCRTHDYMGAAKAAMF